MNPESLLKILAIKVLQEEESRSMITKVCTSNWISEERRAQGLGYITQFRQLIVRRELSSVQDSLKVG